MKIHEVDPPRRFAVGAGKIELSHVADLEMEADENVTFKTATGTEYDITKKSFGYYATPSLNGRLSEHGLRAALAIGQPREGQDKPRAYLMLVEPDGDEEFERYMEAEGMYVLAWLDSDEGVEEVERKLGSGG